MKISNKIVLIGDYYTGKTTFLANFMNIKTINIGSTVGAACYSKNIYKDDEEYHFNIWDTAGQERFRSIIPIYYRDASACLLFFDITNRDSFNNLEYWITNVLQYNIKILIIANKIDYDISKWVVGEEDIKKLCQKYNTEYIMVSSFDIEPVKNTIQDFFINLLSDKNTLIEEKLPENFIKPNKENYFDNFFDFCSLL